ncbi:hypothetical protein SH449x_002466 [Pirellulaceae bacterium SH449]
MQVPPAGWANPAAHAQQSLSSQRTSSASTSESASKTVSPIEQSQKAGDRDANERYDGPMQHHADKEADQQPAAEDTATGSDSLHLPADDGETSQLDISA